MEIQNRIAFVTGGASGIGRATVVALAGKGASVVFADLDEEGAEETIGRAGVVDRVVFRACDVTNGDDLAAAVDSAVGVFGRLDIVANIAGIGDGGDLFADDPGDWRRVVDIDLTAVVDATRLAVRAMRRGGHGGVVVNLASLIGLHPMAAAPVYSAAKAGVVNFTRSLAHLAAESGIRVNAICPELVDTPMALAMGDEALAELRASGSILAPEDVAACLVHLIEDDSRAVQSCRSRAPRERRSSTDVRPRTHQRCSVHWVARPVAPCAEHARSIGPRDHPTEVASCGRNRQSVAVRSCDHEGLRRPGNADHMALRISEVADHKVCSWILLGTQQARPPEALGVLERGLDVGNADVEDRVAVVISPSAYAAWDSGSVARRVALDEAVVARL